MTFKSIIPMAVFVLMLGTPLQAGHKHRDGCGHVYSRDHGGWVSVDVFSGRGFGFSFSKGHSPYYRDYGHDRYYRSGPPYGRAHGYYRNSYRDDYRCDRCVRAKRRSCDHGREHRH